MLENMQKNIKIIVNQLKNKIKLTVPDSNEGVKQVTAYHCPFMDKLDKNVTEILWKMMTKALNTLLNTTEKSKLVSNIFFFRKIDLLGGNMLRKCSSMFEHIFSMPRNPHP